MSWPKGRKPWNLGKPASEEMRRKLSESHMGYKHTTEQTEKIAAAHRGKPRSEEVKRKIKASLVGKRHPSERCEKNSEGHKGIPAWNKGIPCSEETKKKLSAFNTGKHHSEETLEKMKALHPSAETREKISKAQKGKFRSAETIRKMLARRGKTRLEDKFQRIIDKNGLPYKFVGDGSFMIGRKNPDFINVNGQKIAVEVYARYYKLRHADTVQAWKDEREKVFREYGWTAIFFDETQVNENNILQQLRR